MFNNIDNIDYKIYQRSHYTCYSTLINARVLYFQ